MKAISLWQPWASLVVIGAKRFETRSWKTDVRGPVLIHAAKTQEGFGDVFGGLAEVMRKHGLRWETLPFGAIIGCVKIIDCHAVESPRVTAFLDRYPEEEAVGNFGPGRFAWELETVSDITNKPIPFKGKQGFFFVPGREVEL